MTILKFIVSIGVALTLAACGGGGGSAGGTSNTGGGTTAAPKLAISLSSASVSAAAPGTVTATLTDARNDPVAGQVVTFSVIRGLAQTNVTTALTNSSGQAVASLAPTSVGSAGADEVVATASYAGTSLSAVTGFQVQSTNVTIDEFTSAAASISAGGETTLTLRLTGASVGSPVNLTITSSCVTQGRATLSPSSITATGPVATLRFRDNGCGSLAQSPATAFTDQLQVAVVGSVVTRSLSLSIERPGASSIAFVQATPEVIFLRASGFTETSQVRFEVRDSNGNPLPRESVTLTLLTSAGGLTAQGNDGSAVGAGVAVVRATDDNGLVELRINSGTVPTPVRVEAAITAAPTVRTVSSDLSVAVGLPSQLNFSLSQGTINIEGYDIDGTTNTYQIIAADRSGNPVPAGTSINFVTEGGQIEAIKQTALVNGIARVTANFVSSSPRPVDGRITVTAYALGEESYVDLNGDNAFNGNEPFQDLGDIFKDRNFDGLYDPTVDEFVPLAVSNSSACLAPTSPLLVLDPSIPTVGASTCDGVWSGAGEVYVRRSVQTVLATSSARPLWGSTRGLSNSCDSSKIDMQVGPNPTDLAEFVMAGFDTWYGGGTDTLPFVIADNNPGSAALGLRPRLNPMAAGTTVTATSPTTGMTVSVGGGSPVPSTPEPTSAAVVYTFTDPAVTSGIIFVTFRSPGGLGTTISVPVVRGARPSVCTL